MITHTNNQPFTTHLPHNQPTHNQPQPTDTQPPKELTQDDEEEKNWKGIVIALLVILAIGGLVGLAIFIVSLS